MNLEFFLCRFHSRGDWQRCWLVQGQCLCTAVEVWNSCHFNSHQSCSFQKAFRWMQNNMIGRGTSELNHIIADMHLLVSPCNFWEKTLGRWSCYHWTWKTHRLQSWLVTMEHQSVVKYEMHQSQCQHWNWISVRAVLIVYFPSTQKVHCLNLSDGVHPHTVVPLYYDMFGKPYLQGGRHGLVTEMTCHMCIAWNRNDLSYYGG